MNSTVTSGLDSGGQGKAALETGSVIIEHKSMLTYQDTCGDVQHTGVRMSTLFSLDRAARPASASAWCQWFRFKVKTGSDNCDSATWVRNMAARDCDRECSRRLIFESGGSSKVES